MFRHDQSCGRLWTLVSLLVSCCRHGSSDSSIACGIPPQNVRYEELARICTAHFGAARQTGTSHAIYRTPWPGDPRVTIQRGSDGKAKAYQVRQVLAAIDKLAQEQGRTPDE